jgi:hypothetical protein
MRPALAVRARADLTPFVPFVDQEYYDVIIMGADVDPTEA